MPTEVAVIDYGVGNLLSVRRGLEHCGATVTVTADHDAILSAQKVVLPGVGAFSNAMSELRRLGLDSVVGEVAARGIPLLGICLGMQMLLDESEEFGLTEGLALIPGRVVQIPTVDANGGCLKIPHIGWGSLVMAQDRQSWAETPLQDVAPGDAVYFVHSYTARPVDVRHRVADCDYGGVKVSAFVARGRVFGCQFHPEKSGTIGLRILQRFLAL